MLTYDPLELDDSPRPLGSTSFPNWTRRINPEGYVRVKLPAEHWLAGCTSNGWIQEHSFVMASMLGRPLRRGENVHHINGVKSDNSPDNLELWLVAQPPGQRPSDFRHCPGCSCAAA